MESASRLLLKISHAYNSWNLAQTRSSHRSGSRRDVSSPVPSSGHTTKAGVCRSCQTAGVNTCNGRDDGSVRSEIPAYGCSSSTSVSAFGGASTKRIVLPQWFNSSSEPGLRVDSRPWRSADTGRRFWAFVSTGPLTLLTLANLVVAWESQSKGRVVVGAGDTLMERIATFSYFIPTAIRLMRGGSAPSR